MSFRMRRARKAVEELEAELSELRRENADLRVKRQQPLDPHEVAADLHDRQLLGALQATDEPESLLDLALTRQGLLEVCEQLQVLVGQIHRQLLDGTRPSEIDKRVVELPGSFRRRATDADSPHLVPPLAGRSRRATSEDHTTRLPPIQNGRPGSRPAPMGQEATT